MNDDLKLHIILFIIFAIIIMFVLGFYIGFLLKDAWQYERVREMIAKEMTVSQRKMELIEDYMQKLKEKGYGTYK